MTLRARALIIWLTLLSLGLAVGAWVQLDRNEPTSDRVQIVQLHQDPCADVPGRPLSDPKNRIHSDACQTRTCVRNFDVGYRLTAECERRLIAQQLPTIEGEVVGGGGNNPSGQPGEPPRSPTPGDNPPDPTPGGGGNTGGGPTIGQGVGQAIDGVVDTGCTATSQLGRPVCLNP